MGLIVPGGVDAAAVSAYPELQHLVNLREAGWSFLPIEAGRDQIDGFLEWPDGWRDVIRVKDSGDALGLRLNRDYAITWECTGSLDEVGRALLSLPHPGSPLAPRLARGKGPNLR